MRRLITTLALCVLSAPLGANAGGYQSGSLPEILTLGDQSAYVPTDRQLLRNHQVASRELSKLGSGYEKCYAKAVRNHARGRDTGIETCLARARARYEAKILALEQRGPGLAECVDFRNLADVVGIVQQSFTAWTYCASASGALVDGPILY